MKYAILSFNNRPECVYIENEKGVTVHRRGFDKEQSRAEQENIDRTKQKTIADVIGSGASMYDHEYGSYSGANKKRIDDLIKLFDSDEN